MAIKKPQKKFPTRLTKKDKKNSNLSWTNKTYKKRFSNTVSQKKVSTKVAKNFEKIQKMGS